MKLKSIREAAQKTQEQVARDAGVDPAVISRLERSSKPPKAYVSVMRIAHALNVNPLEICPVPGLDFPKAVNS